MALQVKNNKGLTNEQGIEVLNPYIYLTVANNGGKLTVSIQVFGDKTLKAEGYRPERISQIPSAYQYDYIRPEANDTLLYSCEQLKSSIVSEVEGITLDDIDIVDLT